MNNSGIGGSPVDDDNRVELGRCVVGIVAWKYGDAIITQVPLHEGESWQDTHARAIASVLMLNPELESVIRHLARAHVYPILKGYC